ncbi:hypothetical protein [Streptomyces sp. NPDC060322]|uniref:hypothetical protein n=1 Tax=Streptomyces sp. NPDC060322 TaxID=3347097 RepID=UPI00365C9E95
MLTRPEPPVLTPTAGLLASLAVWHWVDETVAGPVAFLLFAHLPPRLPGESLDVIEARMRGLSKSLGLASPDAPLPDIGDRLFMHRETDAALLLDGCDYFLHAPIGGEWARFVCAGGTVAVTVGLAPLPRHVAQEVVEAYLVERAVEGRLLMGKTRATDPWKPRAQSGAAT